MFKLKTLSQNCPKTPRTKAGKWVARLVRNEDGVAALEFAMIAPILFFLYFGLIEISLAVEADRNLSHAASLVGDLAAQNEEVTISMMENFIYATLAVLDVDAQEAQTDVGLELYSFQLDLSGDPEEVGFATFGNSFDNGTHFDGDTIDPKLLTSTSGVVVARLNYTYTSPVTTQFINEKVFEEVYLLKPRRSAVVSFDNGNTGHEMTCTLASTGSGTPTANCGPL